MPCGADTAYCCLTSFVIYPLKRETITTMRDTIISVGKIAATVASVPERFAVVMTFLVIGTPTAKIIITATTTPTTPSMLKPCSVLR
jgi:hypothetical protein